MKSTLLGLTALLLAATTAFAQSGTPAERRACTMDARRYCRDVIGIEMLVLACLQDNRVRISRACRKVLRDHGQ
jgi:hypothetical protein